MGVMMTKDVANNSELNRRIASDLRMRTVSMERERDPDYVEDSAYTEETKKTGKFTWVWIVLVILAILSLLSMLW